MPEIDVAELARDLQKTSANLKRHITEEATRRAAELGKIYAKAADERIRDKEDELLRARDVIAEFRRQREPLERAAEKASRLATVIRRAHYAGETTISVKALLDIINGPAPLASKEN